MRRLDVPLALASAVAIAVATEVAVEPSSRDSTVAAVALGVVTGGLLLFRRRHPVPVLVLSLVAIMGYNLTDFPSVSPIWPLLVPLYTVARAGQPLIGVAVGVSTLLVSTGWVLNAGVDPLRLLDGALREAAMLALALVAGTAFRTAELYAREAEARLAAEQAERVRESARLVLAERIRIARELHDVTAHTVAVVGIQLNLARELVGRDPEAARELLDGARQVNVDAIDELRRAVRLLREPGAATAPELRSPPDETQLGTLLDRAAEAGLTTTFDREGEPWPLPPTVGLTLYRIAQESVTNVLRHADARSVTLTLRYAPDGVGLDVRDDGRGGDSGAASAGHGLTGMRERATGLGGTLHAGPLPDAGYAVSAWLPRTIHPAGGSVPAIAAGGSGPAEVAEASAVADGTVPGRGGRDDPAAGGSVPAEVADRGRAVDAGRVAGATTAPDRAG
ncbi:histidine kinase [Plantactinospora mayteni]|uniref:histidine kinase n=1 Tax=Plantactinospora mayteni TaxID=566021 RepID=A0ABQ4EZQ9_9ACTN|nr:sensor histidine kinase [Plantactinospora mayteni]GIH00149.1 two-component sensor histidine kinase [Plantactinospora mayteni]